MHTVKMKVPAKFELGNVPLEFTVYKDGETLGHLRVSKGGVTWAPKGTSINVIPMRWPTFDKIMKERR